MTNEEITALVERLGWHHEHPVTGKLVLKNPDGPEAASALTELQRIASYETEVAAAEIEGRKAAEAERDELRASLKLFNNWNFPADIQNLTVQLSEAEARAAALQEKLERAREANGILEDALQEAGDDYPGSSMQQWCQQQVKRARATLTETADGQERVE